MLGISYGELFLILGATAALIGPKDLPKIARTAGRFAGRAIGYVQMARGQFDSVMQQSQASQVHKELQDTIAQLEAIRYEIRSISIMNPAPFTRRLDGAAEPPTNNNSNIVNNDGYCDDPFFCWLDIVFLYLFLVQKLIRLRILPGGSGTVMGDRQISPAMNITMGFSSVDAVSLRVQSQATAYARLAGVSSVKSSLIENSDGRPKLNNERDGLLSVLPVSAESAGFLPKRDGESTGSDIMMDAVLEAEVARSAKQFFSQPENQIPQVKRYLKNEPASSHIVSIVTM